MMAIASDDERRYERAGRWLLRRAIAARRALARADRRVIEAAWRRLAGRPRGAMGGSGVADV